jgi:hypothetical protein
MLGFIVLYLLIIQEFIDVNTTAGYRTCPKHILFYRLHIEQVKGLNQHRHNL